jgi:hypothetical protein
VPASTNTGLLPRETPGTYKIYLNSDQFVASTSKLSTLVCRLHRADFVVISSYKADGQGPTPTNGNTLVKLYFGVIVC